MFFGNSGSPSEPTVTVAELPPGARLLDVREDAEWRAGHVVDAQHIPLGQLVERLAEVDAAGEVYVICKAGGRSAQATRFLVGQGRSALNVAGGMMAWAAAGRPMVSGSGAEPTVL